MGFLAMRAESFFILRRKPIKVASSWARPCTCSPKPQDYDISFLITNFHTEQMLKHKLVDFVIQVRHELAKRLPSQ